MSLLCSSRKQKGLHRWATFSSNPFHWCVKKLASFSALVGYTPLVWAGIPPGHSPPGDAHAPSGFDALSLSPRVLLRPSTSASVRTAIFGFSHWIRHAPEEGFWIALSLL
ncbi:hypothetical protein FA13DRAFT_507686 [Coprinellus micaceus]|uniref:Uncharacterized protein n=1 Tax=Coprinellus micaceus TaxID=71717 RepID=A0A4Y7SBT2_COPMI|nr:hypothetical protein FA13DRAFT_507686 [Coprinellus micaceus]